MITQTISSETTTTLPVPLAVVKEHLRLDSDDQDTLLEIYTKAAIKQCEAIVGFRVYPLVVDVVSDGYSTILCKYAPVTSIVEDSAKTIDSEGIETPLVKDTHYTLLDYFGQTCISFITTDLPVGGTIKLSYNAGYTDQTLPAQMQVAALLMIGDMYLNGEDVPSTRILSAAERLLQTDRLSML